MARSDEPVKIEIAATMSELSARPAPFPTAGRALAFGARALVEPNGFTNHGAGI